MGGSGRTKGIAILLALLLVPTVGIGAWAAARGADGPRVEDSAVQLQEPRTADDVDERDDTDDVDERDDDQADAEDRDDADAGDDAEDRDDADDGDDVDDGDDD